jgi:hypothetical protein
MGQDVPGQPEGAFVGGMHRARMMGRAQGHSQALGSSAPGSRAKNGVRGSRYHLDQPPGSKIHCWNGSRRTAISPYKAQAIANPRLVVSMGVREELPGHDPAQNGCRLAGTPGFANTRPSGPAPSAAPSRAPLLNI